MKEEWIEIQGFDGDYLISNKGRVKSTKAKSHIILKNTIGNHGYYSVALSKNGKVVHTLVHRLVAKAFIENPMNYNCVNHKDEVKTNNNVDNLEWCSYAYNTTYGVRAKQLEDLMVSVSQYTLDGEHIRDFDSFAQAMTESGVPAANIHKVCNGQRNKAGGYIWKYNKHNK